MIKQVLSIENYICRNWDYSAQQKNRCKRPILARLGHLGLVPCHFAMYAVTTVVGIQRGIQSILTLGMNGATVRSAMKSLVYSKKLLTGSYVNLLRFINPQAQFPDDVMLPPYIEPCIGEVLRPSIFKRGNGLISGTVISSLDKVAKHYRNDSTNWLKRHVASRLTYGLLAISALVCRAVDGVIGVSAMILSIATLGHFGALNNVAYRGLQAPGVIRDLFYAVIHCLNPWAGLYCRRPETLMPESQKLSEDLEGALDRYRLSGLADLNITKAANI